MDKVTADFLLEEQHDACRHALERVVAAGGPGAAPHAPDTVPVEGGGTVDLMAALEQSVEAVRSRRADPAAKMMSGINMTCCLCRSASAVSPAVERALSRCWVCGCLMA